MSFVHHSPSVTTFLSLSLELEVNDRAYSDETVNIFRLTFSAAVRLNRFMLCMVELTLATYFIQNRNAISIIQTFSYIAEDYSLCRKFLSTEYFL